jgi:3',5'-cyclic AMP phosphodiesterase CpdA
VSDLHVSRDGVFEPDTFEAGLARVSALAPDVVVASGDLTDWGLRPEFERARALLARFPAPVLTCLGNHDARREGWRVYEELFRPRYYRERVGGLDFLVLDSSQPDLDEGEVGREQRAWLARELRTCALPIVVLHHHTVPVPNTGREMNVLRDAGGLLYALDEFEVPLVLGGHRHYPWAWRLNTTLIAHAGTFSSEKRNWPAGFNLVEVTPERLSVELHAFPGEEARPLADVPLPRRWGGEAPRRLHGVHEGGLAPLAGER